MKDSTRAILVLVGIFVFFGLSYLAYDHIDNSYMLNEPEHVKILEATNDSLETVIEDLTDEKKSLQKQLKEVEADSLDGGDDDE